MTHIYHAAKEKGYKITIASLKGGSVPVDPESLKRFTLDKISEKYWTDKSFRELLGNSHPLSDVTQKEYDLVYLTGGHGTVYDFPDDPTTAHY